MLELGMANDFSDFPCNKCGWCCQRTPCPMGLYLGQKPLTSCGFLKETAPNEFECGLILQEQDQVKYEALKSILLAGEGCSHIYGPHPISLMRELISRGLRPGTENWLLAKSGTLSEYKKMANEGTDPQSVVTALKEFDQFCLEQESK